ncbi:hypothetical protein V2J09_023889 [Rumex salicifolius]
MELGGSIRAGGSAEEEEVVVKGFRTGRRNRAWRCSVTVKVEIQRWRRRHLQADFHGRSATFGD